MTQNRKYNYIAGQISWKSAWHDVFIGIVIALVSIPISMGYASVAGLPVVYGLYGSLLPIILFGLITSSPRFVFGVDAAPAALVCGMLASLGVSPERNEAMRLIPVITLIVALWLFLFYLFKANRILKFISRPVMGGFITGIGITIILMQIPKLFGASAGAGECVELLVHIYKEASKGVHVLSLILGLTTICIILTVRKFFSKVPIQVIVMVFGALATYFGPVGKLGVKTLPEVAAGLPHVITPDFSVLSGRVVEVIFSAMSIALVIFTETMLATSNIGLKYEDKIDSRNEILAYGVGNFAAAAFGVCPVNGSVSRTGIADQYGVKSQIMSLTAGGSMALILLFGTGFIKYLPIPILTGIVISALIGTFEFKLAHKLKKVDRAEFFIFYAVMMSVLILGTVYGVLVGIILAQVTFIIRQSKPVTAFLGVVENIDGYHSLEGRIGMSIPIKNAVIYRFSGALFYANIEQFCQELEDGIRQDTKVVVIDASGIGSIDVSAAERLVHIYHKLRDRGIAFYFAGHVGAVNDQLYNFGAGELIKNGIVRSRISLALREAGIDKPYDLDYEYDLGTKPYSKKLAEFSWAYGAKAEIKMKELVHTVAEEIAKEGLSEPEEIRKREIELAQGYWNYGDEAIFLNELEMELAKMVETGELSDVKENLLEEKILERDSQIKEKINVRDKEVAQHISKQRQEHEESFKKQYPKAYERMIKEREKKNDL